MEHKSQQENDKESAIEKLLTLHSTKNEMSGEQFQKCMENVMKLDYLNVQHVTRLNCVVTGSENLLMTACKFGYIELVRFLIRCNFNVHKTDECGRTASDYAYESSHFACLNELLDVDAPFPKQIDLSKLRKSSSSEDEKKLMSIVERANEWHEQLKSIDANLEKFKNFLVNNKLFRTVYNTENRCALSTALESRNFEAYAFLLSNRFSKGIDELGFNTIFKSVDDNTKKTIQRIHSELFPRTDNFYLAQLLSKTRISFDSHSANLENLYEIYLFLDNIEWNRPILKIVANSDSSDIVFDFSRAGVDFMDPTLNQNTLGVAYKSGYILIGAKNDKSEILGIVAHEFAHYAMQLLYNNGKKPYNENNQLSRSNYKEVVAKYKGCKSNSYIIDSVYSYPDENHEEELIVRVPHLLALHAEEPEKLNELKVEFSDLFKYFEKFVLPDLTIESALIEEKTKLKEFNKDLLLLPSAYKSDLLSSDHPYWTNEAEKLFIRSSIPELELERIIIKLQTVDEKFDSKNVFITLEEINKTENYEFVVKAASFEVKPTIFVIDVNDQQIDNDQNLLFIDVVKRSNVVFISKHSYEYISSYFQEKIIGATFHWKHLSSECQNKILDSEIDFQDTTLRLKEILIDDTIIQTIPIEIMWKRLQIKLKSFSESLPDPPQVIIERKFRFDEEFAFDKLTTENVIDVLYAKRILLISDAAGMGKSCSAVEIATKFKLKHRLLWMVFIDLKKHTKAFDRDDEEYREINPDYISSAICQYDPIFEQKLFKIYFENRKVVFVVDGFDEISPNFKLHVISLLKNIQNSENRLLVTTRPHLAKELQEELGSTPLKLIPFTEENQIEFLKKCSELNSFKSEPKVNELMDKLRLTWDWENSFYSVPINLSMLALVFNRSEDFDDIKIDIYSLYDRFMEEKMKIWLKKGPLAEKECAVINRGQKATLTYFHKLALEQLFDSNELNDLKMREVIDDMDEVEEDTLRIGIVSFESDNSQHFTHRTFAEFLVASYIMNGIFSKNPKIRFFLLFVKSLVKANFEVVRKFMNDFPSEYKTKLNVEALSNFFKNYLLENEQKQESERFSLRFLVREELTTLIKFILETLKFDSNAKIRLVKENFHETVPFLELLKVTWNSIEKFVDERPIESVHEQRIFCS